MARTKTYRYDTADFLKTEKDRELYLKAVAEYRDDDFMAEARDAVERSRIIDGGHHEQKEP